MAARASSTVRSADRPDSTASRRCCESSAMAPSSRPPTASWYRRAHQALSTTAASSTTMTRAYSSAVTGMCTAEECSDPGRGALTVGSGAPAVALPCGLTLGLNGYRCSPMITAITTAIIPVMMTRIRTSRSLAATAS
jgi:hypothetical protein